jgi:hypothetical protein
MADGFLSICGFPYDLHFARQIQQHAQVLPHLVHIIHN